MSFKTELWNNALEYLEDELSDFVFKEYFETSITPLAYENDTFFLQVPDEGNKILLEGQYAVLVENALKYYTQRYIKVKFVVASSNDMVYSENEAIDEIAAAEPKPSVEYNVYNTSYIQFNPKYTFDSFVVGPNNRFAHAASLAVADAPAKKYNPLFIYGGVGLGKTHLMHAIAQHILRKDPTKKVVLLSSEQFLNEFLDAIQNKTNVQFRNKYRNADVLLIDDIQFIAGKNETQNEFFHTFNALQGSNKQIILTSDKPPKEIPHLEDRLRSRFSLGLICDISMPDFETRLAILRKKAKEENYQVSNEILNYIAENIESNIRELEGLLLKVMALNEFYNKPLTLDLVKKQLKDIIDISDKKISMDLITKVVCDYYNISKADILSKRRTKNIAFPRQISMYLSRELTDSSLPAIGDYYGGRDHSTVIHGYDKIKEELKTNGTLEEEIKKITLEIKNSK
ncbi:chromosomal replication initiator protein DnaA [Anaerofustis stercorihominis]|uniref:Chromosomal replication initiator protein DnaA n=2 Tax=Anaerofustis stercorihominis TaxID=214853 RepID=B1C8Z3_9FIRM|nr:chromosomal replication initiator protein DnaA [Anaerofustis stercorihominis]EDS72053.1 chromosomal replication initiator protein DnaA [Anaerofustis stercorihominis DSM 17244]MCQ4795897.1 chromosomal replication initiator protein DnaA [Anaerofustis stercorihominis]RGD74896.1 chromosomal replication initiator protein DnaA [Anaerofustis stercorihominis]